MLLPGPEAQQLATYVGWLLHGTRGGLVAGTLFVLPGFVVILGAVDRLCPVPGDGWLAGLFFGLKAAVLAIVVEAVLRIGRRALETRLSHRHRRACASWRCSSSTCRFRWSSLRAGLVGYSAAGAAGAVRRRRRTAAAGRPRSIDGGLRATPTVRGARCQASPSGWPSGWRRCCRSCLLSAVEHASAHVFGFFSQMAVVTFGGAYAVLAYVAQEAVEQLSAGCNPARCSTGWRWPKPRPGPLVLVLSYVGFLAGLPRAGGLDPLLGRRAGRRCSPPG